MRKKYEAVLFDLDGTLLDTLQDIAGATNEALRCLGFPQHEVEAYKAFIGEGREVLAIRALPEEHRDKVTLSRMLELINNEYNERWADRTRPFPGVPELLDALTAAGIRMAILSNKRQDLSEISTAKFLSRWHFEAVVGARADVPLKPDPRGALEIAQQIGIKPERFLYLGDSGVDMKTATAAGMYAVGALWGFRSAEELREGGARTLIARPEELLPLLSRRSHHS